MQQNSARVLEGTSECTAVPFQGHVLTQTL
jgi:hypothetical protein